MAVSFSCSSLITFILSLLSVVYGVSYDGEQSLPPSSSFFREFIGRSVERLYYEVESRNLSGRVDVYFLPTGNVEDCVKFNVCEAYEGYKHVSIESVKMVASEVEFAETNNAVLVINPSSMEQITVFYIMEMTTTGTTWDKYSMFMLAIIFICAGICFIGAILALLNHKKKNTREQAFVNGNDASKGAVKI